MFCPNCGTSNDEGALFCANCGTRLEFEPVVTEGSAASDNNAVPQQPEVQTQIAAVLHKRIVRRDAHEIRDEIRFILPGDPALMCHFMRRGIDIDVIGIVCIEICLSGKVRIHAGNVRVGHERGQCDLFHRCRQHRLMYSHRLHQCMSSHRMAQWEILQRNHSSFLRRL